MDDLLIFAAAAVAGAINAVAGGGTLVSFPTLLWVGVPSVMANATNTVAIWPGSLGSAWGYRRELQGADSRVYTLIVPSVIGGIAGAVLLRLTPTAVFDRLVPALIFFATIGFMFQERLQRRFNWSATHGDHEGPRWIASALLYQLAVSVYGGYFGAGIGILMLAALSILGLTDIHEMNSLKAVFGGTMNGVAAVYFVWADMVYWPHVVVMGIGAVAGGYGGAGMARRLGRTAVRRIVIAIGFGMAISLFIRR